MKDFYEFASSHPFLTFFLFAVIFDGIGRIGSTRYECSCPVKQEKSDV